MKKVIGIIAEYNPFHNGHIYQIKKIKENYPNSIIIVCTSSSFTQRGELSILNKWEKTKVSLLNGVDIVIELPYVYSTQSSDTFAKYGVSLLEKFHINYLCFGSESNDTTKLLDAAKTQINNIEFDNKVKFYMKEGYNYPTSLNNALKELINYDIKEPNDLLAISYIKEIINNNYNIEVFNIKRTNSYHDLSLDNKIVSASNIRNKLLENKNIKDKVPKETYDILKNKSLENKYFEFLKYKIISETDLEKYVDVDEGLNVRIKKYINKSKSLDELIMNIKTKRYTYNRISRMLNHILCSFTKEENDKIKKLEYIRILGFNENGRTYLNEIKDSIELPILNKYDTKKYKALEIEKRVTDIYSNIYDNIIDQEIKNKPIYIKNNLSK
ncbi:MAG: nucleotidyltransferase [Clostridium sp.]|jgi:cytidyltransferase-like protein|nr:nucleotidyltransferase [Clostridium sp.]